MITTKSRLTRDLDLRLLCHIGDRADTSLRALGLILEGVIRKAKIWSS